MSFRQHTYKRRHYESVQPEPKPLDKLDDLSKKEGENDWSEAKGLIKDIAASVADAALYLPLGVMTSMAAPYALPTAARVMAQGSPLLDKIKGPDEGTAGFDALGMGLIAGGVLGNMAQLAAYASDPKYLLFPLATNLASGLYELVREAWKKNKRIDNEK